MRITIINQFYTPDLSPTAHLSASLAAHLARRGHQVAVVASRGGYVEASKDARQDEREANPAVFRIWTPRLGKATVIKRCIDYGVFYLLALWRLVTMPRQDVIVSLTTPPFIAWTGVLHKLLHPQTRLVLWNMDCYPELAERSQKLRDHGVAAQLMRAFNRALFRRLDHLVCLDTAMADLLVPQYAPRDRPLPVSVIPNWEPASFFPADRAPGPWARRDELGLEGRFVVLYLGNMGYGHRFETVLDAAERLRGEAVTFLFIGGGSRFETVRAEAERRGLDQVILHGYVPKEETPAVMAGADCALITLRNRILGVMSPSKLHANLAMRLPVIYVGPARSNVDDAIRTHGCGVSLRHGDVDGLVDAVRTMMSDPARREAWRASARRAFEQSYCDEVTLPQFDRIIEGLTAREPDLWCVPDAGSQHAPS